MAHTADVAAGLHRRLKKSTELVAQWTSDPQWRPPCETCLKPRGYIPVRLPGEDKGSLVECPRRRDATTCGLALRDEGDARWERQMRLIAAGLLPRYHEATLEGVNSAVRDQITSYLEDLDEHTARGKGLLLVGDKGTGKTMALALVAMQADRLGHGFCFVYAADVYSAMRRRDPEAREYLTGLRRTPLLLFDEFASPFTSDMTIGDLEALLEHRHGSRRPTCIATNLSLKRLQKMEEWARIYDRLREDCWPPGKAIVIPGGSQRGQS